MNPLIVVIIVSRIFIGVAIYLQSLWAIDYHGELYGWVRGSDERAVAIRHPYLVLPTNCTYWLGVRVVSVLRWQSSAPSDTPAESAKSVAPFKGIDGKCFRPSAISPSASRLVRLWMLVCVYFKPRHINLSPRAIIK